MSPQAGYLLQEEIVPRLKSAIPNFVKCVGCEDAYELVQDATAFAAKLMHNAELAGKKIVLNAGGRGARKAIKITAGSVAYYTIQHIKSGRRSTGSSVADVYGSGTQLKGRTRLTSLEEPADWEDGGEIFTFNDVLSNDEEDPGTRAARKIDWEILCSALSERERAVVECIAEGRAFKEVAQAFRVCDSAVQVSKNTLGSKILELMGVDILVEVRRAPRWRDCLEANREKHACRQERRVA